MCVNFSHCPGLVIIQWHILRLGLKLWWRYSQIRSRHYENTLASSRGSPPHACNYWEWWPLNPPRHGGEPGDVAMFMPQLYLAWTLSCFTLLTIYYCTGEDLVMLTIHLFVMILCWMQLQPQSWLWNLTKRFHLLCFRKHSAGVCSAMTPVSTSLYTYLYW